LLYKCKILQSIELYIYFLWLKHLQNWTFREFIIWTKVKLSTYIGFLCFFPFELLIFFLEKRLIFVLNWKSVAPGTYRWIHCACKQCPTFLWCLQSKWLWFFCCYFVWWMILFCTVGLYVCYIRGGSMILTLYFW